MAVALSDFDASELNALSGLNLSDQERIRVRYLLSGVTDEGGTVAGISVSAMDTLYGTVGYLAALDAPGGRDADFNRNQSQGAWAERLLGEYQPTKQSNQDSADNCFIEFGLSDPISPRDLAYDLVRRKHRDILLREGKRPDFLLITSSELNEAPEVSEWSERRLTQSESLYLSTTVLCAIEVKSSLFSFDRREASGLPSISITLKDEELNDLIRWQAETHVPIVIVQVFVDSLHACSLNRFLSNKKARKTTSIVERITGKLTHFLRIPHNQWRVADIVLSGPPQFSIFGDGRVQNPVTWPPAYLANAKFDNLL